MINFRASSLLLKNITRTKYVFIPTNSLHIYVSFRNTNIYQIVYKSRCCRITFSDCHSTRIWRLCTHWSRLQISWCFHIYGLPVAVVHITKPSVFLDLSCKKTYVLKSISLSCDLYWHLISPWYPISLFPNSYDRICYPCSHPHRIPTKHNPQFFPFWKLWFSRGLLIRAPPPNKSKTH